MGAYTGQNAWKDTIYQFEETDVVLAETDNIPLQDLADRTVWLKNRLGSQFVNQKIIAGNVALSKDDIACHYRINAAGLLTVTLQDAAQMPYGAIVPFTSFCAIGAAISIKTLAGQEIFDSENVRGTMYMHHRETLWLAAFADHWEVVHSHGNFFSAGEEIKARKILTNTALYTGQLLVRAQYPRLWEFANSLTLNQELVPDATWNFDGFTYRGCFSTGDGVSTFRLPDERAMHDRMMDLGRGVDFSRIHNYPGGYSADAIKSHTHDLDLDTSNTSIGGNGSGKFTMGNEANEPYMPLLKTKSTGVSENLVKTIGKLNLVKY